MDLLSSGSYYFKTLNTSLRSSREGMKSHIDYEAQYIKLRS